MWCQKMIGSDSVGFLCNRLTCFLLVVLGVASFIYVALGTPVTCWAPPHFVPSQVRYTDQKCWDKDYNYIQIDALIPIDREESNVWLAESVSKWIPLFLVGLGVLAILPTILSAVCCRSLSSSMKPFVNAMKKSDAGDASDDLLGNGAVLPVSGEHVVAVGNKSSVIPLKVNYILSKFFTVSNTMLLFLLFNILVTHNFNDDGFFNMFINKKWFSLRLPVDFMCDLSIRHLATVQRYTFQCHSHMNVLYQYIFLFFWFWLLLVVLISGIDFLVTLTKIFLLNPKKRFVDKYMSGRLHGQASTRYASFVSQFLSDDVIFVLSTNESSLSADKISRALWQSWKVYSEDPEDQSHAHCSAGPATPSSVYPSLPIDQQKC